MKQATLPFAAPPVAPGDPHAHVYTQLQQPLPPSSAAPPQATDLAALDTDQESYSWASTPPLPVAATSPAAAALPPQAQDAALAPPPSVGALDAHSHAQLHPLFRPRAQPPPQPQQNQPDTATPSITMPPNTSQNSNGETSSRSTPRSTRSKAPVSYREDLKAVLREDAKAEAAFLKERASPGSSQQQPKQTRARGEHPAANGGEQSQAKRQRKSQCGPLRSKASSPDVEGRDGAQPASSGKLNDVDDSSDGIEIVSSTIAVSNGNDTPASRAKRDLKRDEPLRLDVRGTPSSKPDAKPHPFFQKRDKVAKQPLAHAAEAIDVDADDAAQPASSKAKGKAKQPPAPLPPMRTEAPSWSLFAQKSSASASSASPSSSGLGKGRSKMPVEAPWPSREEAHVRNLWPTEEGAFAWARAKAEEAAADMSWRRERKQAGSSMDASGGDAYPDLPLQAVNGQRGPPQAERNIRPRIRSQPLTAEVVKDHVNLSSFTSEDGAVTASFQKLLDELHGGLMGSKPRNPQHLLTDAYRPRLAAECLGNERSAAYMRDWLRALLVTAPGPASAAPKAAANRSDARGSAKRRKLGEHAAARTIQKRVDKSRKARRKGSDGEDDDGADMASFIVEDSEEEEAWFDQFRRDRGSSASTAGDRIEDEVAALATSQSSSSALPFTSQVSGTAGDDYPCPPDFATAAHLTNCLLLSGPSGSGKTAAVYACAAELGYEVFELYPGMGRRGGKDLHNAVGDLGRNHMVSSGGTGGGATWRRGEALRQPTLDAATAIGDGGSSSRSEAPVPATGAVRQSLILVEEADVLYEDDKGFWTAIVELIAESRRPVIVTCNEVEMVPASDLPIQEHLEFQLPDRATATAYLQLLAAASEGLLLSPAEVEGILQESRDGTLPLRSDGLGRFPARDGPVHPEMWDQWQHVARSGSGSSSSSSGNDGRGWEKKVDLRQAIHQLSIALATLKRSGAEQEAVHVEVGAEPSESVQSDVEALRREARRSEVLSFVDAQQWEEDSEAYGQPPSLTSAEQQLAPHMHQLFAQPLHVPAQRPGSFRNLPDFRDEMLRRCGHSEEGGERTEKEGWTMDAKRAQTSYHLHHLLAPLRPSCSSTVLPASHAISYGPAVRAMYLWDDIEEAAASALIAATVAAESTGGGGGGRSTRNSLRRDRETYVRWLPLGGERRGDVGGSWSG